jgi:hypothetical protein
VIQPVAITLAPVLIWTRAFAQHLRGHTATTKRLGAKLEIVAKKQVAVLGEARRIERALKRKKNPILAIYYSQR